MQPILTGLHPDPSICRAGDTYVVVTSSFEYLPGLPVHTSTDLRNWTLVGHALQRSTQIDEHEGAPSSGVYAPTVRHHDGRFWITGTNVLDLAHGRGHFVITADDPAGPWSDPVHVPGVIGVDPDLVWDEAGVCRLTWASYAPGAEGIVSAPIDPQTGRLLAEPQKLWQGTGLAFPEAPHLYRVGDWWYLVLAEGGTQRGHTATIARARRLDAPFEPAPTNPILSHRSTDHPVQSVGHADLVELADGTWAAVHLGVRPRGQAPGFHVNGRETFLVGIDWIDGWPVVDESRWPGGVDDTTFTDYFDDDDLDPRWVGVGRFPASFTRRAADGGLAIEAPANTSRRSVLATRVLDDEWVAELNVGDVDGVGSFALRIDDGHWYGFRIRGDEIVAVLAIGPVEHVVGSVPFEDGTHPTLRLASTTPEPRSFLPSPEPDVIELSVDLGDGSARVFGPFGGRYLSTEVAGGFTGRLLAVEALVGTLTVRSIRYQPTRTAELSRKDHP